MNKGFLPFVIRCFITLGVGHLPRAPGTWGSLLALAIAFFLPEGFFISGLLALILLLTPLGTWAVATHLKTASEKDPGYIVIDEAIGLWITLLASYGQGLWMVAGFILFRLLDIYKPGLIGAIDGLKSPSPFRQACLVMADDMLAGLIAASFLTLGWVMKVLWLG